MPGFPIRTPWDHSLVDSSPRPIAASHVLHRLLMPRHPPFALTHLTTENKDARVHCAILNQRPTHNPPENTKHCYQGTTKIAPTHSRYVSQVMPGSSERQPPTPNRAGPVIPSGPNRVLYASASRTSTPFSTKPFQVHVLRPPAVANRRLTSVSAIERPHHHRRAVRAPGPASRPRCSLERR